MSETETQPITAAGSGKSPEEVAFDLLNKLKGQGVWGERNLGAILDMYAECLDATKGLRVYPGQNRVEVPIKNSGANAAPAQAAANVTPAQPAPQQMASAQQPPAAPQQPVQAQPVHTQQQMLAQAYKPA